MQKVVLSDLVMRWSGNVIEMPREYKTLIFVPNCLGPSCEFDRISKSYDLDSAQYKGNIFKEAQRLLPCNTN